MGNTHSACDILVTAILYQIINLSLRLTDIQVAVFINQSHTGRVVATIFQSAQAFNQYGESVFIS
jgi:hypothetical protein